MIFWKTRTGVASSNGIIVSKSTLKEIINNDDQVRKYYAFKAILEFKLLNLVFLRLFLHPKKNSNLQANFCYPKFTSTIL